MSDKGHSRTHASLLLRVKENDASAWDELVDRYGPQIERWCSRWGLQESDVNDVTQTVLLKLVNKLRSFTYNPSHSFRAWLRTVTRHAWIDFASDRQKTGAGSGDSRILARLLTVEAGDDLRAHLEKSFDLELLEHAMANVRVRVIENTWHAFQLTAQEGLSGAEAASRLGMQVAAVYVARSNVQKMIREELERLERPRHP